MDYANGFVIDGAFNREYRYRLPLPVSYNASSQLGH